MSDTQLFESGLLSQNVLGTVLSTDKDTVQVALDMEGESRILSCDLLICSEHGPIHLAMGDTVLLWQSRRAEDRGIIVGRIGPSVGALSTQAVAETTDAPDEIVLEARHSLTLCVGEGSITIRKDGKILIKGKDLVSHAQRMNRIKGGAVAIN